MTPVPWPPRAVFHQALKSASELPLWDSMAQRCPHSQLSKPAAGPGVLHEPPLLHIL